MRLKRKKKPLPGDAPYLPKSPTGRKSVDPLLGGKNQIRKKSSSGKRKGTEIPDKTGGPTVQDPYFLGGRSNITLVGKNEKRIREVGGKSGDCAKKIGKARQGGYYLAHSARRKKNNDGAWKKRK